MSLSTAAPGGIAYMVGSAVASNPLYDIQNSTLDKMYEEYQKKGGAETMDSFLAGFSDVFDLPDISRSSRSAFSSYELVRQQAMEKKALVDQQKMDELVRKQQKKMLDMKHMDPGLQVIRSCAGDVGISCFLAPGNVAV